MPPKKKIPHNAPPAPKKSMKTNDSVSPIQKGMKYFAKLFNSKKNVSSQNKAQLRFRSGSQGKFVKVHNYF